MADFWKSNPRKYCEICKVWFADNKSSVQFHENGLKHKANVERRIRESRIKHQQGANPELNQQLAEIEEEALKKMQEDIRNNPELANDSAYRGQWIKRAPKGFTFDLDNMDHVAGTDFVRKKTPDGQIYYYNIMTKETTWEMPVPGGGKKKAKAPSFEERFKVPEKKLIEQRVWLKQLTTEGVPYYYNTLTQESQWEKPEDFERKIVADVPINRAVLASKGEKRGEGEIKADDGEGDGEPAAKHRREGEESFNPEEVYATAPLEMYGAWQTVEQKQVEEPKEEEEAEDAEDSAAEQPKEVGERDKPVKFSMGDSVKDAKPPKPKKEKKDKGDKALTIAEQKKLEPEIVFENKATPELKIKPAGDGPVTIVPKVNRGNIRQRPHKQV